MTIQQAIEKAIEGGWNKESCVDAMAPGPWNFAKMTQDPLFWQSLGKAMGWKKDWCEEHGEMWRCKWHDFIENLADRKDAESFFEQFKAGEDK